MKLRYYKYLTTLFLASVLTVLALSPEPFGLAQAGPVPVISNSNGIDGFDLYYNTLTYWNNRECAGPPPEFQGNEVMADEFDTVATTGPEGIFPFYALKTEECDYLSSGTAVVREGMYVYFAHGPANSIYRQPITTLLNQEPQPLCKAADAVTCALASPNSLDADDGYLYWSRFDQNEQRNVILRAPLDRSTSPEAVLTALGQTAPIYNLQRIAYEENGQEKVVFLGLVRDGPSFPGTIGTQSSTLYRYIPTGQVFGLAIKVQENTEDYTVHRTWSFGGCCQIHAYLAKGRTILPKNITPGQSDSALLLLNVKTGDLQTVYDPPGLEQVLRVTTDSDLLSPFGNTERQIYISESELSCSAQDYCSTQFPEIKRNSLPLAAADWETIILPLEPGEGPSLGYLRSDDDWLYMLYRTKSSPGVHEIWKIDTDAPPLELDVQAVGLEVVQTIQNMDIDIPLIAGKPTYAKGYATMAANTTGKDSWSVQAELHGFLNGDPLPGSPLSPINNPILDGESDLDVLRAGNDNKGVYLFELPINWVENNWVKEGQLSLALVVDPRGSLPETGSVNNNVAILDKPAVVIERGASCLDTARIWTEPLIGYYQIEGLQEMLARARSLLPVFDFQVFHSGEIIEKPVLEPVIQCGFYFPGIYACPVVPLLVDHPFDWSDPDDEMESDWALLWMMQEEAFGNISSECAVKDDHLIGMIHPAEPNVNGSSARILDNAIVRMESGKNGTSDPWNWPYGGRTLAHELGHNNGRDHIDQTTSAKNCGSSKPDDPSSYPYDGCAIGRSENGQGIFGFDVLSQTSIHPGGAADLMSYATSRWISDFTYNAIAEAIESPIQQKDSLAAGPTILVSGVITPDLGTAEFVSVYNLPEGAAPADRIAEVRHAEAQAQRDNAQTYVLKLLDANNQELATETIIPLEGGELSKSMEMFLTYVDYRLGTVRLLLMDGPDILAERTASEHAPVLELGQPFLDEVTGTLQLAWNAYDEDNAGLDVFSDIIVFTALYSDNDGRTWNAVESSFTKGALVLNANLLPGGSKARLRIIAGDGFHATVATTDAFVMPEHAPVPLISGLRDGQRLRVGETVQIYGLAMDADQGSLPGDQLLWQLGGPETAEYNASPLNLTLFDPGEYHLQLSAEDNSGLVGEESVTFDVLPLEIVDAQEPELDGICNDAGYRETTALPLPASAGEARVWMIHAGKALYVCFADLQMANFLSPAAAAELRVDVNGGGGSQTQGDDIGFQVNQNGLPKVLAGGSVPMAESGEPPAGYTAIINQEGVTWSAEMRIEESILGGWNHAVRLMVQIGQLNEIGGIEARRPLAAAAESPSTWAPAYLGRLPAQPNLPPVADAGEDEVVHIPAPRTISLNGDNSYDLEGSRLSYQWTQVSGPRVSLAGARTANPSFKVSAPAGETELVFQLVVRDGRLPSAADEVVITLLPSPLAPRPSYAPSVLLPLVARP